jgi:hypothetical protein
MAQKYALTTSDNPWNPETQWDEWYAFDNDEKHYNTCGYLARVGMYLSAASDELNESLLQEAIDEIVKQNVIGLETGGEVCYMKVPV